MKYSLIHPCVALCTTLSHCVSASVLDGTVIAPCSSQIFCQGAMLQNIQLARPFADSKTFVDMPTIRPVEQVLAAYEKLPKPLKNDSTLQQFLTQNFGPVGQEIVQSNASVSTDPTFLLQVQSPVVRDFTRQVIDIWPTLTRQMANENLCSGCDSSFVPVKRPFVVAGGRFREIYYWDSYFILEGLLRTKGSYTQIARDTIENFLDFIEEYGFVPNGGRKYYLNRSQPPLLGNMINIYLEHTHDLTILDRALPLLLKEQQFFEQRAVRTNDFVNSTLYRYAVSNVRSITGIFPLTSTNNLQIQPRPESYVEDYQTANNISYYDKNGSIHAVGGLSDADKCKLYQELASGAQTGWDYSSRWLKEPLIAAEDTGIPLRSLSVVDIVPVDLQSIQYSNAQLISSFYHQLGNRTAADHWSRIAKQRMASLQHFNYNETLQSYYDYNLTSGQQNTRIPSNASDAGTQQFFSPAQFYPIAFSAAPRGIMQNKSHILELYQPVIEQLKEFPGGITATNLETGQQWDSPNVWAPLQYFLIKGLLNAVPNAPLDEVDILLHNLALQIAQRFVDSTYCTWRSTGGHHPELKIPRLANTSGNGTMFEKYSNQAIDAVGGGGEYTVVPGFGWTNGVLIWIVDLFGDKLETPKCTTSAVWTNSNGPSLDVVEVEGSQKLFRQQQ